MKTRRGSALLIVLGMISFMVVSAVAFSAWMRYTRLPSSYLRRTSSSRLLVKAALASAIDEIDAAIGENIHPNVGQRAPRAGVGNLSSDRNGVRNENLNNRNVWKQRVYLGTNNVNNLLSPKDTVSTLTFEGLAHIPPPLVNYARYYSRRSTAGQWKRLGFDAGRYAFCALDVSDFLDVNELSANVGRGTSPGTRLSLAHLFERNPLHDRYDAEPSAWDTFLRSFWARTPAEALTASGVPGQDASSSRTDSTRVPLVSIADLNLALNDQRPGSYASPFCSYVENNYGAFYNNAYFNSPDDCTPEGARFRNMTFVTDSWFPPDRDASSGDVIDLATAAGQPFTQAEVESPNGVLYGAVANNSSTAAQRLRTYISGIGLAMLYDYLDVNSIPVSLSIPSTERVAMIAAYQPNFANAAVSISGTPTTTYYLNGTSVGSSPTVAGMYTVEEKTEYRIDPQSFSAPGTVRLTLAYPFRRGRDLADSPDTFTVDGVVEYFFTSGDMGFRPQNLPRPTPNGRNFDVAASGAGVFSAKLSTTTWTPNNVNPQQEADALNDTLSLNTQSAVAQLSQSVGANPFLTVVKEKTETWAMQNGTLAPVAPGTFNIVAQAQGSGAQTVFGIPPLKADGSVDADFTTAATVAGWLNNNTVKTMTLRLAVWLRVRDGDDKTVDLVPAYMGDDKTANGQNDNNNSSMGPAGATLLGRLPPVMRFTGTAVTIDKANGVQVAAPPFNLQPAAVMCPDPRWNWAPEHWRSVADNAKNTFLDNCGRETGTRDCDIFMATSDAGYLQSVYELAFLPRVTGNANGELRSNGLFGNIANPDDNRPDWASTLGDVRNNDFMWTTYRVFKHEALAKPVDAMVSIASNLKETTFSDAIETIASTGNRGFASASHEGLRRDNLEEIGLVNEGGGFKLNPYSDDTNVVVAAFANTPVDWWAAAAEAQNQYGVPLAERKNARTFNGKYAFSAMNANARFAWSDLRKIAGAYIGSIHGGVSAADISNAADLNSNALKNRTETDVTAWEDRWDSLAWDDEPERFCGVTLSSQTDSLFDVDRKFLYGYWRECFAPKQQLFLVFVRAEPTMMGAGVGGKAPPQLGGRAVALVWRDPYSTGDSTKPHPTRVLFYRQFD